MMRITTPIAPSTAATPLSKPIKRMASDYRKHECDLSSPNISANGSCCIGFERPATPTSDDDSLHNEPPDFVSRPRDLSDDDEDYAQQRGPRKKGGYDSRIEQILYENEDLQILITDAGKSHENGGSYIVYTIRTGVGCRLEGISKVLTICRILKFVGGIPNLLPSVPRSLIYTQL